MLNSFLLSRVLLKFESDAEALIAQLSAIVRTPDGSLWVGSDEYLTIERLQPLDTCIYGNHQVFHVDDFVELVDAESEIDIEGMDYADGYLWLIGSHSIKRRQAKGKNPKKDIKRLAKITTDPNRYLLARIPIVEGELVRSGGSDGQVSAAALGQSHSLRMLLQEDDHLRAFLGLPSKDNGLDIEGLATCGNRIFLGLRGPVLRGWAVIIELELEATEPGILTCKDLGKGTLYRKHFVNLNGLGVRDLCFQGKDLIILAGPTMTLDGRMQVFRLKDALTHATDTIWDQGSGMLEVLFDLPLAVGCDRAEGIALFPSLGYDEGLMVVYDAPDPARRPASDSIFADVFRLPT
ncbi:MAG: DUF3616 domain-containing protein [Cyanobacteria bacterium J06635_15]